MNRGSKDFFTRIWIVVHLWKKITIFRSVQNMKHFFTVNYFRNNKTVSFCKINSNYLFLLFFIPQCISRGTMPVKRKHQIFILLCIHFTTVQSDFERVCDSRTEQRGPDSNGICGAMIPEMLHLLCNGQYYVPSKRDVSSRSHKHDKNVGK